MRESARARERASERERVRGAGWGRLTSSKIIVLVLELRFWHLPFHPPC